MLIRYISQARIKQIRKSARKKISKLIKKQRGYCAICGKMMDLELVGIHTDNPQKPTIDHIIDIEFGGDNRHNNLRVVHYICNQTANEKKQDMKTIYFGGANCIECGKLRILTDERCGRCYNKYRKASFIYYYTRLFWVKEKE